MIVQQIIGIERYIFVQQKLSSRLKILTPQFSFLSLSDSGRHEN